MKWNQQWISLLNLWIPAEVIYFLLCAVFWMIKVFLSYGRLAKYSDLKWFTGLFCWHTVYLHNCLYQVYVSLHLDMLNHGSLAKSRIIFCKVVNKTSFYLASEQCAVKFIQATWNSEAVLVLVVNRPAGIEIRVILQ